VSRIDQLLLISGYVVTTRLRKYTMKKKLEKRQIVGWIAVGISTAITCFWALWGIIENFHEGWYYESALSNVGLMFVQYPSPMLIFLVVTLISIFWPRLGGGIHLGVFQMS